MTARSLAPIALAGIMFGASLLALAPTAGADDPLAPIKATVNGDRAKSGCLPLIYSQALENAAQEVVRAKVPGSYRVSGYNGQTQLTYGFGDPQAAAINDAYKSGGGSMISNCALAEFGVGFIRNEEFESDRVAMVFGTPAAAPVAPSPAPAPVPTPAPTPPKVAPTDAVRVSFDRNPVNWTVTVTSTADIPGVCTFVSKNPVLPGSNKKFDIEARGSASFTVLAPPPLAKYHVTVSCTGSFDGKDVEFGHVEQDVTG